MILPNQFTKQWYMSKFQSVIPFRPTERDSDPLVSVVITTHYRNRDLRRALRSVREQHYNSIEIIVVDGSGEGHAQPVADSMDVIYIAEKENRGPMASRSRGIDEASGKYIALLDDDDVFHPEKLQKQVFLLEQKPNVGVVYCGISRPNGRKILPDEQLCGNVLPAMLMFNAVPCIPSTMMIRQSVAKGVFPLKERNSAEDIILNIELARHTFYDFIDEILVHTTDYEDSRSTSLENIDGRWEILQKYEKLYDEHPSEVRRYAVADLYLNKANLILQERWWSSIAIISAAKAAYVVPEWNVLYIGYLLLTFLGQPGVAVGREVHERLLLGDEQRGMKI